MHKLSWFHFQKKKLINTNKIAGSSYVSEFCFTVLTNIMKLQTSVNYNFKKLSYLL